ncbi:hypothetical protein OG874_04610 [Nocardia sp. NBC_00565]|uniref:hypothetical protein n=1 Tax=Nocardia sp. NBC_00565 TaxID=2975993 RepID=UPI002E80BE3C|nr:hypothetical protein [Nocardia sp. NBC_00565]WUC04487.1 hypothetical protein OG874_04610 [Nocardia sp. NBC_00565]
MYPSQPGALEGRHAAGPGMPGQPPRMVGLHTMGGLQGSTPVNALASFVTYVKALEALDKHHFPDEYAIHSDRIKELRPFLRAHGILDVMEIKNPEVAALIGA